LLSLINSGKDLVFIPVNNPGIKGNGLHWSLLVYQKEGNNFYHFDSADGINDNYVKPVVKELLKRIDANLSLENNLVQRYDIEQGNNYDCGIAVIAFTERIIEQGITADFSNLNQNFTSEREK